MKTSRKIRRTDNGNTEKLKQDRKGNDMETINTQGLSEKVYLCLDAPTEEEHASDQIRIIQGLEEKGYRNVRLSLETLREIYPLCRNAGWKITATLV